MYRIIQHKSVIFSECVTKVCLVLNSMVSSLSDRSPWDTCSFRPKFGFSWKHSAILQLLCEDFTHQIPVFYHIMLADMLFADFKYYVGALLYNCMTTVIICFNLRYVICRGPLEQQCIRYLTSNVFGSGPIGTLDKYMRLCKLY